MFVAVNGKNEPIGIHNDVDVITDFILSINEPAKIIEVPRKKAKKLVNYADLYLTRKGDIYLPNYLYEVAEEEVEESTYEYRLVRDTLYRLVEQEDLSKDSINHIRKTLIIIEGILYDLENSTDYGDNPLKTLNDIKELKERYQESIT